MKKNVRIEKDVDDGKKVFTLFSTLSEESKAMAVAYLSALRDKEIIDSEKRKELQEA